MDDLIKFCPFYHASPEKCNWSNVDCSLSMFLGLTRAVEVHVLTVDHTPLTVGENAITLNDFVALGHTDWWHCLQFHWYSIVYLSLFRRGHGCQIRFLLMLILAGCMLTFGHTGRSFSLKSQCKCGSIEHTAIFMSKIFKLIQVYKFRKSLWWCCYLEKTINCRECTGSQINSNHSWWYLAYYNLSLQNIQYYDVLQ